MAATFDNDADMLNRVLGDFRSAINERDAARRSGSSSGGAELATRIRDASQKADKLLEKVAAATRAEPSSALMTQKELQRRRDAWRKLAAELKQLKDLDKKVVQSANRDALGLDGGGGGGGGGGGAGAEAPRQTPEQLLLRSKEEFKVQDDVLDSLSRGLDGLKNLGTAISSEASLHMKLLDDLEEGVDQGDASLRREAARAEFVTRDAKTCWLYITICILLAVMCALVRGQGAHRGTRKCRFFPTAPPPPPLPPQIAFKFH